MVLIEDMPVKGLTERVDSERASQAIILYKWTRGTNRKMLMGDIPFLLCVFVR